MERRKSPSPLFCSSSTSAILSSVIGPSVLDGGLRNSTLSHPSGDHLLPAPNFHHVQGRYPASPFGVHRRSVPKVSRFRAGCAATPEASLLSIAAILSALPSFPNSQSRAPWPLWR